MRGKTAVAALPRLGLAVHYPIQGNLHGFQVWDITQGRTKATRDVPEDGIPESRHGAIRPAH